MYDPVLTIFQNLTDANDLLQKQVDNLKYQLEDAIQQMDRTTEDYAKLKVRHFNQSRSQEELRSKRPKTLT